MSSRSSRSASPAPPPARRPVSAWWFALPTVLAVAAAASFVVLLVTSLQSALKTDAEFAADGATYVITLPAEDERTVFVDAETAVPACTFRDAESGEELDLRGRIGSFTRSIGDDEWQAQWNLATGSGRIEATCAGAPGAAPVQIAPPVDTGEFVGGILATVLVPLALGGLAFVAFIVVTVLFITRRAPRPRP